MTKANMMIRILRIKELWALINKIEGPHNTDNLSTHLAEDAKKEIDQLFEELINA